MTWALQKGTFLNYSSKNMENCWIYSWCIVGIFLEYHWYGISFVSYWYIGWASINTCPVSLPTSLELWNLIWLCCTTLHILIGRCWFWHTHTYTYIYIHLLFSLKTVRKIDISICIHMLRQKSSLDPWPWPFFSPPDCATAVRHSDSTSSGVWVFSQWRTKPDATSSTCGSEGPKLDAVNDCLSNII